jgi:hypothetical protein
MLIKKASLALVGAVAVVCMPSQAAADDKAKALAERIAAAHQREPLLQKRAIRADLVVEFGGNRVVDGVITFSTDGGRSRFEPKSGGVMTFDGTSAWVAPGTKNAGPPPRFHLLTWPYFALAGSKLVDGGTSHGDAKPLPLEGRPHETFKLTFQPGTGDAPKDWYIAYADPQTSRLRAMAYIVTYGVPLEKAEREPHAIAYDDYKTVDGVPISTRWTFYDWKADAGLVGEPRGSATLSNVSFVTPDEKTFAKPQGATEDKLPPAAAGG